MDITEALRIVGTSLVLPGQSDVSLTRRLQASLNLDVGSKPITPAIGLDRGIRIRPVEALHQLSYATRSMFQDDVFDQYVQWGLYRYLGLFDLNSTNLMRPSLRLSEAGARIAGNQRRVTSEEMGIGFGALLAQRWFAQTGAAGSAITVVDIDVAISDRYIFAGGAAMPIRQVSTRRPDYLLIASDPTNRHRYMVRVLECKGTKSKDYAVRQLARAIQQLDGITVDGRIPQGLAVATITADDRVSYLAVDPMDNDEPSYEVTADSIDEASNFVLDDRSRDVPSALLTSAAVAASWAVLADFGSNLAALNRWSPAVMRRRLYRRERDRTTFDTPFGPAFGTRATFGIDGRALTVWRGIDLALDQRLIGPSIDAIEEAQAAFAERLSPLLDEPPAIPDAVYSAAPNGSVFALTLE